MRPHLAALLIALALACPLLAAAAPTPEDRLSGVFESIEANRLDDALKRVDELIRDYPNFRLAHLVRGDLLLARSRPLLTFGNVVKTVPQEKIDGLRQEALLRLLRGRTSLVIAHRLSTILDADRILVMHKGELREQGKHAELLSRGGIYARLYELQYNRQREPDPVG